MALCRRPADKSHGRAPQPHGKQRAMARKRSRWTIGNFGGRSPELQVLLRREQASFRPAQVFVFVDEAEDSIDHGHFLTWPSPGTRWVNLPAGRSAAFSLADGHLEVSKWPVPKRSNPKQQYWKMVESPYDLEDLRCLQAATLPLASFVPQITVRNPPSP